MTNNVRSEVYDGIVQFDTAAISNLTGHDSRFLVHQWVHLYHLSRYQFSAIPVMQRMLEKAEANKMQVLKKINSIAVPVKID